MLFTILIIGYGSNVIPIASLYAYLIVVAKFFEPKWNQDPSELGVGYILFYTFDHVQGTPLSPDARSSCFLGGSLKVPVETPNQNK
jgi:hypothetical protein